MFLEIVLRHSKLSISEVFDYKKKKKVYLYNADISTWLISGIADFTVLKDVSGLPILTPHDQNLKIYNLTVNTALSPTNEACTASERRP